MCSCRTFPFIVRGPQRPWPGWGTARSSQSLGRMPATKARRPLGSGCGPRLCPLGCGAVASALDVPAGPGALGRVRADAARGRHSDSSQAIRGGCDRGIWTRLLGIRASRAPLSPSAACEHACTRTCVQHPAVPREHMAMRCGSPVHPTLQVRRRKASTLVGLALPRARAHVGRGIAG